MKIGYFVTGTDTDIGKTWVTVALMKYFCQCGLKVAGMKPVAAGCDWRAGQLQNADAILLQAHSNLDLSYQQINPYAFAQAVSPHIAAEGVEVKLETILNAYIQLRQCADVVIVEGAGGWLSPLSPTLDNATLAEKLQLPVILVVGIRLGCINHARLSLNAIRQAAISCAGWVAVEIEPDRSDFQANLDYLQVVLDSPLLAVFPYINEQDFDFLAKQIVI